MDAQKRFSIQRTGNSLSPKPSEIGDRRFRITKKVAKHGSQAIIVIPSVLRDVIKPRMLVKVKIDVLDGK